MHSAAGAVAMAILYAAALKPFASSRSSASFFNLSSLSYRPSLPGSKYADGFPSLAYAALMLYRFVRCNDVVPTFLPKDSRPDPPPISLIAAGDDTMYCTPVFWGLAQQ